MVEADELDPDIFFPDSTDADHRKKARKAKAICNRCPMQQICLDWAIRHDEQWGIWGGMSSRNRARLRREYKKEKLL